MTICIDVKGKKMNVQILQVIVKKTRNVQEKPFCFVFWFSFFNLFNQNERYTCFLFNSFLFFFVCFVSSIFFQSYNEKIETFVWFDSFSRKKKLPPFLFGRCLSLLLGQGRRCGFGTMVCDNQLLVRGAQGVSRQVIERGFCFCV